MQREFTYKGATITLHRRRNADLLDAELIVAFLMEGVDTENKRAWQQAWNRAERYAATLVSIDAVNGDPGFPLPPASAPVEALRAGFAAWLAEDGFYKAWLAALATVNAPLGDADTAPGVDDDPKGSAA